MSEFKSDDLAIVDALQVVTERALDNDNQLLVLCQAIIKRVQALQEHVIEHNRVTEIRLNELESRVDALEYQKKNEKIH